jgi:hypothetical protein
MGALGGGLGGPGLVHTVGGQLQCVEHSPSKVCVCEGWAVQRGRVTCRSVRTTTVALPTEK